MCSSVRTVSAMAPDTKAVSRGQTRQSGVPSVGPLGLPPDALWFVSALLSPQCARTDSDGRGRSDVTCAKTEATNSPAIATAPGPGTAGAA
jgi:hypothetical protein